MKRFAVARSIGVAMFIGAALLITGGAGPWDDFRFNYYRGKDSYTAARELGTWARPQGIKVEFELRREGGVDVIYVFPAVR